jgi:hypothetical protein
MACPPKLIRRLGRWERIVSVNCVVEKRKMSTMQWYDAV